MIRIKPYFEVLKNLDFTKLWISQVTSQLTNYLLSFAILIKVFNLTSSSLAVSIIILAFGAATVFFGSLAGVYADRFDRKWLLTVINLLQAICVAAYIPFMDNFWAIVLITFLYSSFNQFYLPAEAPSIPNIVEKKDLLIANSYFAFTGSGALIIGFAAAGPMVEVFGPKSPFWTGFVLLLIATFATFLLPSLKPSPLAKKHFLKNTWSEFLVGLKHFWSNKALHFPLMSLFSVQIINGMLITVAPAFIEQILNLKLERGTFQAVIPLGLGMLAGTLALGPESHYVRKSRLIKRGFAGMGISIVALSVLAFLPSPEIIYLGVAFAAGFFNAHIFAPSHSIIQSFAADEIRGRVYGSLYVILQVAATFPTVIIGVLADKLPLFSVIAGIGILLLILGSRLTPLADAEELDRVVKIS